MSEIKLEYQKLIEETEGLEYAKLPVEIRNKIRSMSGLIGMYNKSKSEKVFKTITQKDVEISNLIQDFIEQDLPDDSGADGDDGAADEKKTPPAAQKQPQQQPKVEEEEEDDDDEEAEEMARRAAQQRQQNQRNAQAAAVAAARAKEEAAARAAAEAAAKAQEEESKDPVKQVLSKLNPKSQISTGELKAIIGRTPDYPREIVGNLVLEKAFMSPYYNLIKQ